MRRLRRMTGYNMMIPSEIYEAFKAHDWIQYDDKFKEASRQVWDVKFALGRAGLIDGAERN